MLRTLKWCAVVLGFATISAAAEGQVTIYWTEFGPGNPPHALKRLVPGAAAPTTVVGGLSHPRWLTLSAALDQVVWAEPGLPQVRSSTLNGGGVTTIAGVTNATAGVAIDAVAAKIYWTESVFPGSGDAIRRSNLDGSNVETLIVDGVLIHPGKIELNGDFQKMYWADVATNIVYRANLDGSGLETVLTPPGVVYGLAFAGPYLYYTQAATGTLHRADLDGANATTILAGLPPIYDLDVDHAGQKLYFNTASSIHRCDFNGSVLETVIGGLPALFGIRLLAGSPPPVPGSGSFSPDFSAPIPGTLGDATGQGTGFTTRLPGTGSSLPLNDPNLVLGNGALSITTTQANIQQLTGMNVLEAPCVRWTGAADQDLVITTRMTNVSLLNSSDQAGIIIGVAPDQNIRLIAHQSNLFIVQERTPNGPGSGFSGSSPLWQFATGAAVRLSATRIAGQWTFCWVAEDTGNTGTLGPVSLAWGDGAVDLYCGVIAENVWTPISYIAQFDAFSVIEIPTPTGAGTGQGNGIGANLTVNGIGGAPLQGPFGAVALYGCPLTFSWTGPPNAPYALLFGPLNVGALSLGVSGSVDLGTPPIFADVHVVFDGTSPPPSASWFNLGPTGAASMTFASPLLPGQALGIQGVVFQQPGSPSSFALTAAFELRTY